MSADHTTIKIYNQYISEYVQLISKESKDKNLIIFMEMIEKDGKVLDLGCGTGSASYELMKKGFTPCPVDASSEMIKVAEALLKIKARNIWFEDIEDYELYDAIWANFSLLHLTKAQFSGILKKLFFALKNDGIFFFSLKKGHGEKRDNLGRFYSYYEKKEVEKNLENANFRTRKYTEGSGSGLSGKKEGWMGFFCEKIRQ